MALNHPEASGNVCMGVRVEGKGGRGMMCVASGARGREEGVKMRELRSAKGKKEAWVSMTIW